ncbi:aspartate/glutamate racemase family protein [Salinicola aestuarinus]|uniref:aspartate/glutamate racemase family protein n=1 Tax=Salinicola aestuarinus TaxID=1949082 RepID=UPI000DA1481A|nr:aspartate/glutamate racemase family protein [Salinicola aestuarinus]
MPRTIRVINPNSSVTVTQGIDAALAPLRLDGGPAITCHTLHDAPPGIQSEADIIKVLPQLAAFIHAHESDSSAFVIGCFSDPGLAMAREASAHPVLGIGESGMMSALIQGQRAGVIAIQPASIPRHLRSWGAMGVTSRIAGERALGLDVEALADEQRTWDRLLTVGRQLRDEDQADVLILGCAGMPHYQHSLSQALDMPVVEPCRAATGMALTAACLAMQD